MGVYGLEWGRKAHRGSGDHGCTAILWHFGWWTRDKLEIPEENRIFQQDNDPKHISKKAKQWFEDNGIQVLAWPAQSLDINPIEHLWVHLKRALQKYPSSLKGVHELWERLVEEWNGIPVEACQKLIKSMPRRIQAVIREKGDHTDY